MAVPSYTSSYSGGWLAQAQRDTLEYQTARVWGTGVHPIHAVRMSEGRGNQTAPDAIAADAAIAEIGQEEKWGYNREDIAGLDYFAEPGYAIDGMPFEPGGWPDWGESATEARADVPFSARHPLRSGGRFKDALRSIRTGARNDNQWRGVSTQIPTETVSEGWLNKVASGMDLGEPGDSEPAADSQVFIMTSQVQRHLTLDNSRALLRGTDMPREAIPSRVTPLIQKHYSGEKRHYDMFPYQIDDIPRPFSNRTAGTGPADYLLANEQWQVSPLQRTPPPDPSMGTVDTEVNSGGSYGYTMEDTGYY